MVQRWECRYSSCEMMYLELTPDGVHMYLDHSPTRGDRYSFDDVLAGAIDAEVRNLFGTGALDELKAAVRERVANRDPVIETKERACLRRRREG